MECLGFQRLLEFSLAAGQICDPIRASLMRKCSLTQRENEYGRREHVKGKREVKRTGKGKNLHEPRILMYHTLPLHRGRQQIASKTHKNAQTLIMNEEEAVLLSLCGGIRTL